MLLLHLRGQPFYTLNRCIQCSHFEDSLLLLENMNIYQKYIYVGTVRISPRKCRPFKPAETLI